MASQGGTSRLAQMQMRFQQKQQQEREQRKVEMTGGNKITMESIESKSVTSSIGPGKVRQMFDERRQRSTGIDKSYPLKPIPNRTSSGSGSSTTSSSITTTVRKQVSTVKQITKKTESEICTTKKSNVLNGNATIPSAEINIEEVDNTNHYENNNEVLNSPIENKLPNVGKLASGNLENNRKLNGNFSGDKNNNSSRTASNASIKLKPVVTKKTLPSEQKILKKVDSNTTKSASKQSTVILRPEKSLPTLTKPKTNAKSVMNTKSKSSEKFQNQENNDSPSIPENMAVCHICGRNFNIDRIEKHREICEKMATKKRKIFDASKHRVKGTEAEQYVRKATKSPKTVTSSKPVVETLATKKGNWRKKHEEFIQAIRAAKEVQAHLARGGKLSDLPPPPPSENPDYVQCPHCKRRFNEAAANRHIPKCADMQHNKPKPGALTKKGSKR